MNEDIEEVKEAFEKAWNVFMSPVEPGTMHFMCITDRRGRRYDFDREHDGICSVVDGYLTSCCEEFRLRVCDDYVDIDLLWNKRVQSFMMVPLDGIVRISTSTGVFKEGYLEDVDAVVHYEREEE